MESIQYIILAISAAILAISALVLVKVNEVARELRTPVVKKLNPDFSKQARKVQVPENRGNNPNRDNRPLQQGQRPAAQGQQNGQPSARPQQSGENRDNRGERNDRNRDNRGDRNRDNRGDRNRDNRGERRDNRGERNRRPEIMGNESAESSPSLADEASTESVLTQRTIEVRPTSEGRRPLEPRTTEVAPVASVSSVSAESSVAPAATESVDFDPSRMRHGRRPQLRRNPALDDVAPEAPASTPNA